MCLGFPPFVRVLGQRALVLMRRQRLVDEVAMRWWFRRRHRRGSLEEKREGLILFLDWGQQPKCAMRDLISLPFDPGPVHDPTWASLEISSGYLSGKSLQWWCGSHGVVV